jgi:hypothetical protein
MLASWGAGCLFCAFYANELQLGCIPGCVAVCALEEQGQHPGAQPHWIADVTSATWYGSSACHVWNENNICGSYSDGSLAQIYAGNFYDQAMIIGHMSGDAHGDIWLTGYSVPGTTPIIKFGYRMTAQTGEATLFIQVKSMTRQLQNTTFTAATRALTLGT